MNGMVWYGMVWYGMYIKDGLNNGVCFNLDAKPTRRPKIHGLRSVRAFFLNKVGKVR